MPSIVPPTKGEVRWRAAGYFAITLVGVFIMLDRGYNPDGVRSTLGFWSATVWSVFMGTGLIAAAVTLKQRWRIEYIVLPLFGIALLVAILAAWGGVVVSDPTDWQKAARAASATALLFFLLARYVNLRRLVRAVKAHEPWTTRQ